MKSELSPVAQHYATAVFELASASGSTTLAEAVLEDLQAINEVLNTMPEFNKILNHPALPSQEKKNILVELFKDKIQELTLRLFELLVDKRRLELLPYIETQYQKCIDRSKGMITATLSSADSMSQQEVEEINSMLSKQLGKKLQLNIVIDQSLIGGACLQVGDQVFDGSIKAKLVNLEKSLLSA
jgi:F-type H+-transporting ATPase subunit delta